MNSLDAFVLCRNIVLLLIFMVFSAIHAKTDLAGLLPKIRRQLRNARQRYIKEKKGQAEGSFVEIKMSKFE